MFKPTWSVDVMFICFASYTRRRHWNGFLFCSIVSDALRNIFGQQESMPVVSYGSTIDSALANVTIVMNSYAQNRPVSRRQRASQRPRFGPYNRHISAQKKRRVVQALSYTPVLERNNEPWCYKSFRKIWEGNIEYSDQSSQSEILTAICEASNLSPPIRKPNATPLKKEQLRFVHRKNGKVTTRQSAVYDGLGISCNYRQGCIYVEIVMPTTCTTTTNVSPIISLISAILLGLVGAPPSH